MSRIHFLRIQVLLCRLNEFTLKHTHFIKQEGQDTYWEYFIGVY